MPTVPLGPLTDDATERERNELRRLRVAYAVGHRLSDRAVDPAPDPRLRPRRLAGRAARLDRREVLGVDRLRRRSASHLHARPAPRQRDGLLVHGNRRVLRPPVLGERGPAPPVDPAVMAALIGPVTVPTGCSIFPGSSVARRDVGPSTGSRTSTGGTSPPEAATSLRSSSRRCSSTRSGPPSVPCAEPSSAPEPPRSVCRR